MMMARGCQRLALGIKGERNRRVLETVPDGGGMVCPN